MSNSSVFSSFPPDEGPHLLRSLVELACYPRLESGFDAAEQTYKQFIHREAVVPFSTEVGSMDCGTEDCRYVSFQRS
jgi:hypothetical protein